MSFEAAPHGNTSQTAGGNTIDMEMENEINHSYSKLIHQGSKDSKDLDKLIIN